MRERPTALPAPVEVFFSLGSNIEPKAERLAQARSELAKLPTTEITDVSSLYRTAPVGRTDQDWFLNQVVRGRTQLPPDDLLERALAIEAALGRVRHERWGPRTIDIDILLYGEHVQNDPTLTLPHPRMTERAFVLVPLAELAPERRIGSLTVREHLEALADAERRGVEVFTTS